MTFWILHYHKQYLRKHFGKMHFSSKPLV